MAQNKDNPRLSVPYWDGVNSTVQHNIAKPQELAHSENVRSVVIGTIEKRDGMAKLGTTANGSPFYATANYGLVEFINDGSNQDIFRVATAPAQDASTLTISLWESVFVHEQFQVAADTPLFPITVLAIEYITVSEPTFFIRKDGDVAILDGTSSASSIYALSPASVWTQLSDADAQNIIGATIDSAAVDTNLVLVNGRDYNRLISSDGTTVVTSAQEGSLFNSPRAYKVSYYKNRIYLGNYTRSGIRYKTTILRSSYPLGIVALLNGDDLYIDGSTTTGGNGTWTLAVTDTKYFYTDAGMNAYEVYRGPTKIATLTATVIGSTSITFTVVFSGAFTTFQSSDEIWISGTFSGTKQYRWSNSNQTSTAQSSTQYDTFKLSGGREDDITLMEPIGNVLLISNKEALMVWNDFMLESMNLGVGCISSRGYTKLMGSLYFLHYSGIYSTTGGVPLLISRKVERYLSGATRQGLENCAAGFKGLSVFFAIGDVSLYNKDDSFWKTLPNACLEFNIANQTWYVHTNVSASQFMTFVDSVGVQRLLLSSSASGKSVKEFLVGNTDDGEIIFFRADTQPLSFSRSFELYSDPLEIVSEVDRGASMECFVALDDDDFYPIEGTFRKGISTLKITSKDPQRAQPTPCRRIRVSFRDSSKQKCKLLQASIVYNPTNMSAPDGE